MDKEFVRGHRGCHYITCNIKLCKKNLQKQAVPYKILKNNIGAKESMT